MALFAEMTAEGWALIIAAVFAGLGGGLATASSIVVLVLGFLERGRTADRAAAVEQVKLTLQMNMEKQEKQASRQDAKLEEIHQGVNGMNKTIEEAGFARGVKSETDKIAKPEAKS